MKTISLIGGKGELPQALEKALALEPSVLFLFAAPSLLRDEETLTLLRSRGRGLNLVGCSTAGEIANEGVGEKGFSLLAIHFEETRVRLASCRLANGKDSRLVGEDVGRDLKTPELRAVFVFGPGTNVNGSELASGLSASLGKNVVIAGGLAADELDFKNTHTLCGEEIYEDRVVAVGFYGSRISVSCGSEGGWRPFGPARRVTKASGNILQELDGKPALQLYKQYLGEKAKQLPASGLSYPFAILRGDRTMSGLIRSALDIDRENEALVMAGDVPQGCQVCLMHADTDALIQGAAQAAAEALRTHKGPEEGGCALLVNCIGRRMVLGLDAEEEVEAVKDSFLPDIPMAGYYSYGEISSENKTGLAELYNQTMTIAYITERGEDDGPFA